MYALGSQVPQGYKPRHSMSQGASIVHTLRGKAAYNAAVAYGDPLYIEPPGAQDDGSPAKGERVSPSSSKAKDMLREAPERLACNVMD
jgi:hypothetical protein